MGVKFEVFMVCWYNCGEWHLSSGYCTRWAYRSSPSFRSFLYFPSKDKKSWDWKLIGGSLGKSIVR